MLFFRSAHTFIEDLKIKDWKEEILSTHEPKDNRYDNINIRRHPHGTFSLLLAGRWPSRGSPGQAGSLRYPSLSLNGPLWCRVSMGTWSDPQGSRLKLQAWVFTRHTLGDHFLIPLWFPALSLQTNFSVMMCHWREESKKTTL